MVTTGAGGVDTALKHMAYGVYVVTTRGPQGDHGLTASWVTQVSNDPPLVAVAIRKGSASEKAISKAAAFAVNILSSEHADLAERFFTPVDRFQSPPKPSVGRSVLQLPLLEDAIGWLECEVQERLEPGDHVVFVGRVIFGGLESTEKPLTTIAAGFAYGGTGR